MVDDIVLVDKLGVDFYGVGEYYRWEFVVLLLVIVLVVVVGNIKYIILGSIVIVLLISDFICVY